MKTSTPDQITKEQYALRSTFFYNKLSSLGFFGLPEKMRRYAELEDPSLDWTKRQEWGISDDAWNLLGRYEIAPAVLFAHPKVIQLLPS